VCQLALAFDAVVEGLAVTLVPASVTFDEAPSFLGEGDGSFAISRHTNRLDQSLLAQVSEIARARVRGSVMVVTKVTTGDHSKRTNGCERTRFGSTQRVLTVTVSHELAFRSARQVEMTRERLARVSVARARPALARVAWSASDVAPFAMSVAGAGR
jgi:hypothetical protein